MQNLTNYSNYVSAAYAVTIITIVIFFSMVIYRYLKLKSKLKTVKNEK